MRFLVKYFILFLLMPAAYAQRDGPNAKLTYGTHGLHHLSVLVANTHASGEGNSPTIGLDYEYRVNKLLGVGAILERADGKLNATTLLAVADIHFWNGLIMQVGPGFERSNHDSIFVTRLGVLYEFEVENFTISPQLHWDYHDGEPNTIVAGAAFGFSF